jgi:uncharacterized protein (DUF488 family)
MNQPTIFTIGHSTRNIEEFIELLKSNGVSKIMDIRTIPRSRHNPQFNKDSLPGSLAEAGISYEHCSGLGGLRKPLADSPNDGWRDAAFRGFADYMLTGEFINNLAGLVEQSKQYQIAVMCAEAVPWRCHRSLIADAVTVRGIPVQHIISNTSIKKHTLTPWARMSGERIIYPSPENVIKEGD